MEDKVTLQLTVKGDKETIKNALDSVEGVESIEYKDSAEKDCVDVMIQSDPKTEVRELIFYRLAAVQCPIYAMNQMKKSLEDVFIELTADTASADAEGQSAAAAEDIQAKAGEYIAAATAEKTETDMAAENSSETGAEAAAESSNEDSGKEEAEHDGDL